MELILFLVANKQLYIRVCPSIRPWVRPSIARFFSNRGIQAKKWSNFHQCPCPTFATIGRPVRLVVSFITSMSIQIKTKFLVYLVV